MDSTLEIQTFTWQEVVLKRPAMYLGVEKPSGEAIAEAIERSARILGSGSTSLLNIKGWWVFSAENDWLFNSEVKFQSAAEIFGGFQPFPEPNEPNWFRTECLCLPFSERVYTFNGKSTEILKGLPPAEHEQRQHRKAATFSGRSIAYLLPAKA